VASSKNKTGASTRKGRTTKKAGRRKRLPASISDHEKAVETIGRKRIEKGSHLIGVSNFLTPTKRGFNSLRKVLKAIEGVKTPSTFTYKLKVMRPDGTVKDIIPRPANIIPRHKREQRLAAKLEKAKRGQKTIVLRELFMERVRSEVFGNAVEITEAESKTYRQIRTRSKSEARSYLKKLQEKKGIKFQFEIYREI
jgi:hypothetical protein